MKVNELHPILLVQSGRELLKVSTIYHDNRVSAELVYPVQPRTTMRFYSAAEVEAWKPPSKILLNHYDDAC